MKRGFTIIEILVLIVLTGAVAVVIINDIKAGSNSDKIYETKRWMLSLKTELDNFMYDMGSYPYPKDPVEDGIGLLALVDKEAIEYGINGEMLDKNKWKGPYVKKHNFLIDESKDGSKDDEEKSTRKSGSGKRKKRWSFVDAWGESLIYEMDRENEGEGYRLISKGPDGIKDPEKEEEDEGKPKKEEEEDNKPKDDIIVTPPEK